MANLSIQRLSSETIDEAYVLARLCDAGLTLPAWRLRAAAHDASPAEGGALLARDLEARPCGLVVYALTDQADGRRSLQVEALIGFDVLDPKRVASALIAEVIRLARAEGCATLCLIGPLGESPEVVAQVLAAGVAVLPSLIWSSPPVERATRTLDLGQGRQPLRLVN